MSITESSISLNFPDDNYFRFQDCQAYKNIQHNFKEMDVCWYEQASNTLYIIELKDWQNNKLVEEMNPNFSLEKIEEMKVGISEHRIMELLKKSVDSLCMFFSILLDKPYASNLQNCSPFRINKDTKIRLLSIINWTNPDSTYISHINTAYKSKFKPYAKLFSVNALVLTKEQATRLFNWVA